jgi:hypothetical protein
LVILLPLYLQLIVALLPLGRKPVEMSKLGIYGNSKKGSFPEKFSDEIMGL